MSLSKLFLKFYNLPPKNFYLTANEPKLYVVWFYTPTGHLVPKLCYFETIFENEICIILNSKGSQTWKLQDIEVKNLFENKLSFISQVDEDTYCMLSSANLVEQSVLKASERPFSNYVSTVTRFSVIKNIIDAKDQNADFLIMYIENGVMHNKIQSAEQLINSLLNI